MQRLDGAEVRVLGALLEKDLATPEYYPLTLNALVAACNQRHNRDPVVSYDEDTVDDALEGLRQKKLAVTVTGPGLRVPKHKHLLGEAFNLGRRELAVMCVLMLRGPQTVGEVRDRTERMHSFADLEEVESVLDHLIERESVPQVARLPRLPGTKEPRYAHLLAGEPDVATAASSEPPPRADRLGALEAEVARLREELDDLKRQFCDFRRQFE